MSSVGGDLVDTHSIVIYISSQGSVCVILVACLLFFHSFDAVDWWQEGHPVSKTSASAVLKGSSLKDLA